jgi:hypothetical protein
MNRFRFEVNALRYHGAFSAAEFTVADRHQSTTLHPPVAFFGSGQMPFQATAIRVLIASPGDLEEERDIVVEAINDWNAANAFDDSVVLLPVRWETHATPETGIRPQAAINSQLVKECDLLVGMFWTRLGSNTGVAESGTVEEIDQFVAAGKPAMLYFSRRLVDPGKINWKEQERLHEFKSIRKANALVQEFSQLDDLRRLLVGHLNTQVRKLRSHADTPAPANFGVRVTSPAPRDRVTSPVIVTGTIERPLPPNTELWLFTTGDWEGDDGYWPQDVATGGDVWSVAYYPKDVHRWPLRRLQMFVVGPNGRALISSFRKTNKHFAVPANKNWVPLTRLTSDITPVSGVIEVTCEIPAGTGA